jgi:hypothetical protein
VWTLGLTFRPIAELAIKLDYQHKSTAPTATDAGTSWNQVAAGLGFMF